MLDESQNAAIEKAIDTIVQDSTISEIAKETVQAIIAIGEKIANVPDFLKASISWLGKMSLGGLAGAAITAGVGKAFEIAGSKLDKNRKAEADRAIAAIGNVGDVQFIRYLDDYVAQGKEMPLDKQVELRIDIANKLAEQYPVKDASFWASALEMAGKALQSNFGISAGVVLGVLATKLFIPFPEL